jgi:tetratricopeptide (TPR) repeat protein
MAAAKDPFYAYFSLMSMSAAYVLTDQIKDAKETSRQGTQFFNDNHIRSEGAFCELFYGVALIAEGQMSAGMRIIDEVRTHFRENKRHLFFVVSDLALGKVYSEIAFGPKPSLSVMINNFGFLLKHAPYAGKKAAEYFKKAIAGSEKISSLSLQGQACLDLGLLYKCRRQKQRAKECISQAVELFNKGDARTFLKQAQQELAQL